jgi:hypothetical protein
LAASLESAVTVYVHWDAAVPVHSTAAAPGHVILAPAPAGAHWAPLGSRSGQDCMVAPGCSGTLTPSVKHFGGVETTPTRAGHGAAFVKLV